MTKAAFWTEVHSLVLFKRVALFVKNKFFEGILQYHVIKISTLTLTLHLKTFYLIW